MSEERTVYQVESIKQGETELTTSEQQALLRLIRTTERGQPVEFALIGLSRLERLLIASAVSRIGQALDEVMPGWRES